MSKIDDLIGKMCPDGVVSIRLDAVVSFHRGDQLNSGDLVPGPYRVITAGREVVLFHSEKNVTGESITISSHGAYAGHVNYFKDPVWLANNVFLMQAMSKCIAKFIYYVLKNSENNIQGIAKGGGIPYINQKDIELLIIPLPPLEIQKEIVAILDKFTELEVELEVELEARKKQYEYYRHNLLTFDLDLVPTAVLGNIYEFQYGKGNTIPTIGGKYPVYGSNGVVGSHKEFNSEDAPVVGHIGAYAGIVNWADGKHFVTYNGVICKILDGNDPRYGYHLLMKQNLRELANKGSQPFVSYDKLKNVKVQLPKFEEQVKIARLLDSLDAFVNHISIGLPAEIKARRQQYEYYRNKLLTFKELDVV